MNIGDRVKVELEMKVSQLEEGTAGTIILSGYSDKTWVRVPQAACSVVEAGVTTILKEIYAK